MAIQAYIDGACSGNPGPGGWGVLLLTESGEREISGYEPVTTNNRMELTAAIRLLQHLSPDVHAVIFADSQYVVKGITEWLKGWKSRGWRNAQNKAVENRDLWEQLDALLAERGPGVLTWQWVRGHNGNVHNERVDQIAVKAMRERKADEGAAAAPSLPAPAPTAHPEPVSATARMTYIRHSGAWHRHTVAIPGIDRFSVDVETADLTASFTVEILRDPEGERSRLCIDDADLAVLTAVPAFFAAYTAAAKARGAGMSSDAVEILLLREGALDTTPRTKPTSA